MNKNNTKIALISFQQDADRVPPIGLVYIATCLKRKIGVKNIKIFDKNYHDIEKNVEEYKPDLIGIGAMTINYADALRFAKRFKKNHPTPIIIGGVHISTLPESFEPCFDVGVIGEGEQTFSELVNLYLKKEKLVAKDLKKVKGIIFLNKGNLIKNPIRQLIKLDSLPFPDFDFVEKDYFKPREIPGISKLKIKFYISTSRGCPYKCVFCSTSRFWKKVRLHSPGYVAKFLKNAIEKYNATYFVITDDLFTVSAQRLKDLKEEFKRQGILNKIEGIECQPRTNLINDELCQLMKDLKVKIVNFGFESGSERILHWLKAGSVTTEMNRNAILLCQKYGFNVYGSLMFGSPGEKIEDIKKTLSFIDFAVKNGARYIWSFISTPFPGTPFWDIALKRGKVSKHMNWGLLSHHNLEYPLLLDEDIDKNEFKELFLKGRKKLRKLRFKMIYLFIVKNPMIILKLLISEPAYYLKRFIRQVYKQ